MASGAHKAKEDPTRWIKLSADYNFDFHRANVGYFFTLSLAPSVPPMTWVKPGMFAPLLTPLGKLVDARLEEISKRHPEVKIEARALMSDHLHVCFWVSQPIARTIIQMLTTMMCFCEREACAQFNLKSLWRRPGELFVCYSTKTYQQKKNYTLGNLTRWHLELEKKKAAHPHLVIHAKLDAAYQWEGYGHEALLDETHFLPCYITRSASEKDVALFTRLAIKLADAGWILVGGFVSERERALLKAVRQQCRQPRVIHLAATKLIDRKLPAQLAYAIANQTILRLTSAEGEETCQRTLCVWQNLWAERFCGDWRTRVIETFVKQDIPPKQEENLRHFLARWKSPHPAKYHGTRPLP